MERWDGGVLRGRRRVGRVGQSRSFVLHLPMVWAEAVGLRNGSLVEVVFGVGRLLIIAPAGSERETRRLLQALRSSGRGAEEEGAG